MKMEDIISEIKLELTGQVLEMEIDEDTMIQVVNKALRELERFWDETTLITVPFASCIDFGKHKDRDGNLVDNISSIVGVYRSEGLGTSDAAKNNYDNDPLYMQQWSIFSNGGTMYNLNDYMLNYMSWITLSKIKNTMATDMSYKEDRHNNKLYINSSMSTPKYVTIEYVPKLNSVEDIKSDYWIDILIKLSVALTKIVLGRIRTRFTQSNALWTQDGETLLNEGNTELKELREVLRLNANMIYLLD